MEARTHLVAGGLRGTQASSQSIVSHSIFDRYTEAARKAIFQARCEAQRRGAAILTVADLLAGLSHDEGTRAGRIGALKENAFYLRWLSGLPALPMNSPATGQDCDPELDPEVRRALAYAVVEADRDREYWIDTDHLLRGLMRFANKAHFAVLKTEFNLHTARLASGEDRAEHLPEETPSLKVVQYLVRKHAALWGPPVLSLACYLYILIQSVSVQASPLAR